MDSFEIVRCGAGEKMNARKVHMCDLGDGKFHGLTEIIPFCFEDKDEEEEEM